MKKNVILVLSLFLLFGCKHSDRVIVNPNLDSHHITINDFTLSPNADSMVVLSNDKLYSYKFHDKKMIPMDIKSGEDLKGYKWVWKESSWKIEKLEDSEGEQENRNEYVPVEKSIYGELYDETYNRNGTLEIRLITFDNKNVLALVDNESGNFNIIYQVENALDIKTYNISPNKVIVKLFYNDKTDYMIYFKDNNEIKQLNTLTINNFVGSAGLGIYSPNNKGWENFYKRNIPLEGFELIEINLRENLIMYRDYTDKKVKVANLGTNETYILNIDGITDGMVVGAGEAYLVSKYDRKNTVYKANLINGEYVTIFTSNELIYKLWEYDGDIYFVGTTTQQGENRYNFYRVYQGGIKNIFHNYNINN